MAKGKLGKLEAFLKDFRYDYADILSQVHFIQSVQRVAKRLSHQNKQNREVFVTIGQQILKAKYANEVMALFTMMKGEYPLTESKLDKANK